MIMTLSFAPASEEFEELLHDSLKITETELDAKVWAAILIDTLNVVEAECGNLQSHQNPLTKLVLGNLCRLARLPYNNEKAFADCQRLQVGEEIQVEINP